MCSMFIYVYFTYVCCVFYFIRDISILGFMTSNRMMKSEECGGDGFELIDVLVQNLTRKLKKIMKELT